MWSTLLSTAHYMTLIPDSDDVLIILKILMILMTTLIPADA
jgi:hypothetical protein